MKFGKNIDEDAVGQGIHRNQRIFTLKQWEKMALCTVAVCLLFALSACQEQPTWQEQYDLGMRYLTESNYEQAIIAFTSAMKVKPQNMDTYVYLAQVYLASGDPEMAQQILTQGYDATQDGRLDCSSVDAWFLYNPSLDFDQQLAYRDFAFLSTDQQNTIRQVVAAAKADEGSTIQTLLSNSNLPPQLFTCLDGEQLEISILPETDDELYLKAYEAMSHQYLAELEEQGESYRTGNIEKVGQFLALTIRPANGTEYSWCSQDITYRISYEGQTIPMTMQAEAFLSTECENWEYNGDWKSRSTMWVNGAKDAYTYVETSGTAAAGEKFKDGPMIMKNVREGMEIVYEFQGDQMIAYYIVDPATGQRVDMIDLMNGLSDLAIQMEG